MYMLTLAGALGNLPSGRCAWSLNSKKDTKFSGQFRSDSFSSFGEFEAYILKTFYCNLHYLFKDEFTHDEMGRPYQTPLVVSNEFSSSAYTLTGLEACGYNTHRRCLNSAFRITDLGASFTSIVVVLAEKWHILKYVSHEIPPCLCFKNNRSP